MTKISQSKPSSPSSAHQISASSCRHTMDGDGNFFSIRKIQLCARKSTCPAILRSMHESKVAHQHQSPGEYVQVTEAAIQAAVDFTENQATDIYTHCRNKDVSHLDRDTRLKEDHAIGLTHQDWPLEKHLAIYRGKALPPRKAFGSGVARFANVAGRGGIPSLDTKGPGYCQPDQNLDRTKKSFNRRILANSLRLYKDDTKVARVRPNGHIQAIAQKTKPLFFTFASGREAPTFNR